MKRVYLMSLLTICAVSTALATTYVRVEKDGTKTYSDRPMPGGQPVELQPAQSYSAPPTAPNANSRLPREQQLLSQVDNFKYSSCSVTPANDTSFTNPESVSVAAVVNPPLRAGDFVTLTVDGQAVGNSSSYNMAPAYRGTHTVAMTVKNSRGQVLCSSSSSFHVMRPSLNAPARR